MAGYTYILTNCRKTVLYTGSTNCIERRVSDHKLRSNRNSFSCRYNVDQLVFLEEFSTKKESFLREMQIKGLTRDEKVLLIEKENPGWRDLSEDLILDNRKRVYKK